MDDDQGVAASRAQRELTSDAELAATHKRAKQVFLDVIEHPAAERAAVLERLCQGDAALQREVASLLEHHRHDSLISTPAQACTPQDETAADTRPHSPVGKQIGSIRVERQVGEGGMSTVYLGHDAHLGRRVALKALRSRGFDKEHRSRFLREARVLSRLKHTNICEIYGYEETAEEDFLILEYIDGRSLRDVPTEELPLRERDRIAVALADALQVAHAAGVVHRDLKPENVMLTSQGHVKVLDFGIARMEDWEDLAASSPSEAVSDGATLEAGPLTRNGRILGTPHYMSPEQARGEPISPASDIFSLGLLLYELYLGRSVHPADLSSPVLLERVQRGVVPPIEGLSRNRKRLLQRMLSVDAASRPTVTEVAQALRRIRDRRARLLFVSTIVSVLGIVVLIGVNYVLEITRAWTQAEAARGQVDIMADTILDDMFNRLSLRDRYIMLERLWRLPLTLLPDLPDRLLRESVLRFAQRVGTTGRMRLLSGDTAGIEVAFSRMFWLDELGVSAQDDATLRRKLTELVAQSAVMTQGRAAPQVALASYQQASTFYTRQLAGGRDTERWRSRLAMTSMLLGQTYLQSGELLAARASFERARALYDALQRASVGAKQRIFRQLATEILRALAETEYYAANLDAALDAAHGSVRGYTTLTQELPFLSDVKANLGESYLMLGRVLQGKGDSDGALIAFEKSRAILAPLHAADPHHCRLFTLLALADLTLARVSRQRGELDAAQRALAAADALTSTVTIESLLIAQDVRAQILLELGRVQDARPLVEQLIGIGWQNDLNHRDFAQLATQPASR